MAQDLNKYLGLSEEDRKSELKLLKSSWDMYENTRHETEEIRKNAVDRYGNKKYSEESTKKTLSLLETMQADIAKKYLMLGGTMEELKAKKRGRKSKDYRDKMSLFKAILEKEKNKAVSDYKKGREIKDGRIIEISGATEGINEDTVEISYFHDDNLDINEQPLLTMPEIHAPSEEEEGNPLEENVSYENYVKSPENEKVETDNEEPIKPNVKDSFTVDVTKAMGQNIKYDVIPLPSKGQAYRNKMNKIPVSYLTAYDENLIISPNMYKDGTFLDYILKAKVMTDEIDPSDMLPGDRDAIILWLRASGYGNEFPVTATDNVTGKQFDSFVDLTKLKYKTFNLKGDINGHFSYELPVSKDKIKFKFLTYGDLKELEKMEEDEVASIRQGKVYEIAETLQEYVDKEDDVDRDIKINMGNAIKYVRQFADAINKTDEDNLYTHAVTNRLAASIVSVNGITDRKYIDEYIMYMNVRDSSALRKYISDNEPGVDFNIEIERPESLGGGSVRMFLSIDQFIFLTFAR